MYLVVSFDDESVEVVPSVWVENKDKSFQIGGKVVCAFPPKSLFSSLRKLVKNASTANSFWSSYNAVILYTSDDFEKASGKARKYISKATVSTTDCDEPRNKKPPVRFLFDQSEGSPKKNTIGIDSGDYDCSNVSTMSPVVRQQLFLNDTLLSRSVLGKEMAVNVTKCTLDNDVQKHIPPWGIQILKNQAIIIAQLKEMKSLYSSKPCVVSADLSASSEVLPFSLPITTITDLKSANQCLSQNFENMNLCSRNLSLAGGRCIPSSTRAILMKLLHPNLANKLSWVGSETRACFRELIFINKVVFRACQIQHQGATEMLVKNATVAWLRNARDRVAGEKRKHGQATIRVQNQCTPQKMASNRVSFSGNDTENASDDRNIKCK